MASNFRVYALAAALSISPVPGQAQTAAAPVDAEQLQRAAAALPQLHTLLVSWRGALVAEYYARDAYRTRAANIKSASKSIITALVGIAIAQGRIPSVHEPIATWFPELRRDPDARKRTITIEHLLTMQPGLESTSGENYGRWVRSRNWVSHALARPMVSDPGTSMEYSTGTSHLLSAILTKTTGRSTWQFAQETLGPALGSPLAAWPRDPQGIYFGGNEMLLTPTQMVAMGELYLRKGRDGTRQVVPAEWVETSCAPRTVSQWDGTRQYGYGWWIQGIGGHEACFAWGFGGQYIIVFPKLDLVVSATSSTTVSDERHGHRSALFALITEQILTPLSQATQNEE